MKLFKRHKKAAEERHYAWQDKTAMLIVNAINKIQTGFAKMMHQNINHLSRPKIKVVCIIFFLCTGSISGHILIKGLTKDGEIYPSLQIKKIDFPTSANKNQEEKNTITENEYRSVILFKNFMDSLYGTVRGRRVYDSIVKARPGLMDTARMLKSLYLLQQNQ